MLKNYNPWGRPGGGAPMVSQPKVMCRSSVAMIVIAGTDSVLLKVLYMYRNKVVVSYQYLHVSS